MILHIKNSLSKFSRIKQPSCLFLALIALSACSENSNKSTEDNISYHQSAALMTISPKQNYTIKRDYLGQITAKQHTSLGFEYAGRVSDIFIDNGDTVKKGQLLAKQDTQLLGYKASELQAQIDQSQAQISLNKANLSRIKTLISDGYSSKQRLDELNAENKILNAQINGLNARIETIEYQREKSALVAPFDGVITKRFISNGEMVTPSVPSFRIIESTNMEINVGIPSKIASVLALEQTIEIKIAEQNKQAKVIAIGYQIDSINRTVPVRLKMIGELDKNKDFNGQLVRVSIEQKIDESGFWIPIDAITDAVRGQWQIFIASAPKNSTSNYQLQAATVKILHTNEHSVYVNGLEIKQHQIVAQGVHRYVSGQVVNKSMHTLAKSEGVR